MFKSKLFPYLEAGFAAVVWGASFIATKIVLKDISPITIVWIRFAMGLIILGLAVVLRKQLHYPRKMNGVILLYLDFWESLFINGCNPMD